MISYTDYYTPPPSNVNIGLSQFFIFIMREVCLRLFIYALVFILCDLENSVLKILKNLPDFSYEIKTKL